MSDIERYEAEGDVLKGKVIRHGRGLPSIMAMTYCLADARTIASALNAQGAVGENERLREALEAAEVTFAKVGMPVYADACRAALDHPGGQ